jgi:T4 superinfection immunity protein
MIRAMGLGAGAIHNGALLIVLGLYFLPTIVAFSRKVINRGSVAVINMFLGWTLIGWVVAFAMAVRTRTIPRR